VLTHQQNEFVESVVRTGEYQDANEMIRDALRALKQRRQEDALKLKALRVLIKTGANALDEEHFTEIDDADLDRFLAARAGMPRTRGS
jgi:antitoxin ParD1/3/4